MTLMGDEVFFQLPVDPPHGYILEIEAIDKHTFILEKMTEAIKAIEARLDKLEERLENQQLMIDSYLTLLQSNKLIDDNLEKRIRKLEGGVE